MKALDNYQCEGQISIFDWLGPDTWSGKTCPELSVRTREKISDASLKKPRKSQIKTPLFLDLRGGAGQTQAVSWQMGGVLLGVYMMHSFGECPREEKESRLSQILEVNPPQKYCLSERACQGILNRANRRGKKLPEILEQALIRQATPSKLGGGVEVDSKGNKAGKGPLVQTELSGTLGVSQDQTLICLEGNGSRESHHGPGYSESDKMYSLNTVEQHAVAYSIDEKMGNTYIHTEQGNTLSARDYKQPQAVCYQEKTGALTPGAHAGSYNGQDAYNDMLIVGMKNE